MLHDMNISRFRRQSLNFLWIVRQLICSYACFSPLRPVELLQSKEEYTEDDITDQVHRGSFPVGSSKQGELDFSGLFSGIEAIKESFKFPGLFGGTLGRFFEAAKELKDAFISIFRDPHKGDSSSSSASKHQGGVPIESDSQREEASLEQNNPKSGDVDLSGLAKDV